MALDGTTIESEPEVNFRTVKISEFQDAFKIIDACSDDLVNQGLDHWKSWYTLERVARTIQEQKLLGYYQDKTLVGLVKLVKDCPYGEEEFSQMELTKEDLAMLNPMYLGTLGVHPDYQGRGFASKILSLAYENAAQMGHSTIIIDARMEVGGLIDFYSKRGFIELGRFSEGENQTYLIMQKSIR